LIGALHILKKSKSGIGELGSISQIVKRLNALTLANHYSLGPPTPAYVYIGMERRRAFAEHSLSLLAKSRDGNQIVIPQ
jgi:hypothetical protein